MSVEVIRSSGLYFQFDSAGTSENPRCSDEHQPPKEQLTSKPLGDSQTSIPNFEATIDRPSYCHGKEVRIGNGVLRDAKRIITDLNTKIKKLEKQRSSLDSYKNRGKIDHLNRSIASLKSQRENHIQSQKAYRNTLR